MEKKITTKQTADTKPRAHADGIPVYCAYDEIVPIGQLRPNPKNPNKHPQDQLEKLGKIIRGNGWRNPITVSTRSGLIVKGHGRLLTAELEELKEVPVEYQNYESEEAELADLTADNRIAELAEMDAKMLADVFEDIDTGAFDFELSGYTEEEYQDLISSFSDVTDDDLNDPDVISEPPEDPVTMYGDIWILGGQHRVMCGDSTNPKEVAKLMNGEKADLLVTDPPYNVDYEGSAGKIQNDNMTDANFRAFLRDAFKAADANMNEGAAFYIFHADSEGYNFRGACRDIGWTIRECLIWVKNALVLGRQDYQWRHEPCLYGWKAGAAHYFTDDRSITTVFDDTQRPDFEEMSKEEMAALLKNIYDASDTIPQSIIYCDKPTRSAEHPTMKPTLLVEQLVENSSKRGWNVLDLFGGSGTTLVACEKLARTGYLMELDAKFVDVIVKRYITLTGSTNVKCIRNGKEVKREVIAEIFED